MGMNRRNALIGMGTIAASGGALFATGAFSTVEAERTFSVQVASDDQAILGLGAVDSTYVSETDGVLEVDLAAEFDLNYDAETDFGELWSITNNHDSNPFDVSVDLDPNDASAFTGTLSDVIEMNVPTDGSGTVASGGSSEADLTAGSLTWPSGETVNVNFVVDLIGFDESDFSGSGQQTLLDTISYTATDSSA